MGGVAPIKIVGDDTSLFIAENVSNFNIRILTFIFFAQSRKFHAVIFVEKKTSLWIFYANNNGEFWVPIFYTVFS